MFLLLLSHNLILQFETLLDEIQHYFVMKIRPKKEFQQILFNHSSDIDFHDFLNLYKKCTEKTHP